jgi:6-phospho-3-hexuloisomerase
MKLEYGSDIAAEIAAVLEQVDDRQAEALVGEILRANRIFAGGSGRSGLMVKAFVMRMMHLGLPVFVLGEIVTPAFHEGDLLIICSGSGETRGSVVMAEKAQQLGGRVSLITIAGGSTIGKFAVTELYIPAPSPKHSGGPALSIQPMASLLEQCMLLVLDIVIIKLMKRKNMDSEAMMKNHVNLE